ncbi:unnamed protein product [Angiostrongylus costaricensis]|uniref:BPTI/Kunitz inhibitor domain-containing protein n=1 Tax=Angiostrongylus costaricensis TaxID=334426 RepID=A0A158PFW3_ANGCS|nr:unnamed protein product [Angiostrongylus costaricensis]
MWAWPRFETLPSLIPCGVSCNPEIAILGISQSCRYPKPFVDIGRMIAALRFGFMRDGNDSCCLLTNRLRSKSNVVGDSFLTGEFTSIATIDCPPYRCDFPRQVCMRLNTRYQEISANECRPVPVECLTAANGGIPLIIQPPSPARTVDKPWKERGAFSGFSEKNIGELHPMPINPTDICQMGPPNGRFCGFKVMYTYNKETFQCDEFWFPGCTTVETNANLFSDMRSCEKLAEMCKCAFIFVELTHRLSRFPFFRIHLSVRNSALGGPSPSVRPSEGDGEDLGIFGLIQQSIQNAQAIKQGGPQGKQAAAAAAGQILQQFTGFDLNNLGGNFGNLFGR